MVEILELINEKRKYKTVNKTRYQKLQSQIRSKIKAAKKVYYSEKCYEMRQKWKHCNTNSEISE